MKHLKIVFHVYSNSVYWNREIITVLNLEVIEFIQTS